MAIDIVARALALQNSSGTGETTDYNQLSNLPLINSVQLKGNVSLSALGILGKNNTESFIPTGDYNPATKKYVDDSINTIVGSINTVLATLTTPTE